MRFCSLDFLKKKNSYRFGTSPLVTLLPLFVFLCCLNCLNLTMLLLASSSCAYCVNKATRTGNRHELSILALPLSVFVLDLYLILLISDRVEIISNKKLQKTIKKLINSF